MFTCYSNRRSILKLMLFTLNPKMRTSHCWYLKIHSDPNVWPLTLGTGSSSRAKCLASDTGESGPANLISLDLDSDGKHLAMGPAKDTKTHPKRHKCVEFYLGFQSKSFSNRIQTVKKCIFGHQTSEFYLETLSFYDCDTRAIHTCSFPVGYMG